MQAGVGGHVIDTRPAEAKQALAAISRTSLDTLTEIRHILGTLRRDSGHDQGPARGLADLGQLAAEMTEIGVPVTVWVNGQRNGLPLGIDLAGYRVVQEALTNVLKHAGKTHADVAVRYEPSALTIEITNDGADGSAQTAPHVPGSGRGLTGMRERVAAWGGTLKAGPRADGGFRVFAHLPYEPT